MAETTRGRGRLSSIDLMPSECDGIIAWAAQELGNRERTQTEIYAEFVERCEALMREHRGELEFKIPAFSSFNRYATLSVILTANQRAAFDNFYADDCAQGAALFWMPDATRDGWALLTHDGQPLLTHDGTPILLASRWLCAWGDAPPIETIQGIEFRKQFQVVVMP